MTRHSQRYHHKSPSLPPSTVIMRMGPPGPKLENIFDLNCFDVKEMSSVKAVCHVDIRDEIKTQFSVQEVDYFEEMFDIKMIDLRTLDKIYLQTGFIPHYKCLEQKYYKLLDDKSSNGSTGASNGSIGDNSCDKKYSNGAHSIQNHFNHSNEPKSTDPEPSDASNELSSMNSTPKNSCKAKSKLATILNQQNEKNSSLIINGGKPRDVALASLKENEFSFNVVFGDSVRTANNESFFYYAFKTSAAYILNKINDSIEKKMETNSLVPCCPESRSKIIINLCGTWYRGFSSSSSVPNMLTVRLVDIGRYLDMDKEKISCFEIPDDPLLSMQRPLAFPIRVDRHMRPGSVARVEQVNDHTPVEAIILEYLGIENSGVLSDTYSLQNCKPSAKPPENLPTRLVKEFQSLQLKTSTEDRTFKDKPINIFSGNMEMNKCQVVTVVDKTTEYLIVSLCSGFRSKPHNYNNVDLLVKVNESDDIKYEHIQEDEYVLVLDSETGRWHRALLINKETSTFYLTDTGKYCTSPGQYKRLLTNMLDMPPQVLKVQINPTLLKLVQVQNTIEILPLCMSDKVTINAQLLFAPRFVLESPTPLTLHQKVKAHFGVTDVIDSSISYFFTRFDTFPSTVLEIHSLIKKATKLINVNVGDYCGVIQDENVYCRAKVLKVEADSATVFMIDYGEVDIVERALCWELPDEVFAYPPCIVTTKPLDAVDHLTAKAEVTLVPQEEISRQVYSVRILD